MANDARSLTEILRELKALAVKKSSGFFFIATTDNHSCTIRMHAGTIEDVIYSRSRGDDAVQLLSHTQGGRGRFQPDPGSIGGGRSKLSQTAQNWLLGGFETGPLAGEDDPVQPVVQPAVSRADAAPVAGVIASPRQRRVIQEAALHYLGPIASIICDEAFESAVDIDGVIDIVAGNLGSADEGLRFRREVRAALGPG
ncbi:hypothetical protein [Dyella sp.]|uniref:hypothetical protein n=1 Tax=Dyella sp. TaxID=1869338 RepID=UPI002ED14309